MDAHVATLTSATLDSHAIAQKMLHSSHMEVAPHHKHCDGQISSPDLVQNECLKNKTTTNNFKLPVTHNQFKF